MTDGNCLSCSSAEGVASVNYTDPLIGTVLNGRYRLQSVLGSGGWGTVYKGEDVELGRPVAVKMLHKHWLPDKDKLRRFQREATTLSKVMNSYLVVVFDYGLLPQPFIVLEYVQGETLQKRLGSGPLSPADAVEMFCHLCEGVQALHKQGFVHRDIKPSNVILDENSKQPKLLDLGVVKLTAGPAPSQATETGATVGTVAYMSPEQCQGYSIDQRSDIYSLGCTMFEALTGKPPFEGNDIQCMFHHINDPPPRLSQFLHGANCDASKLEKIVSRCLEKELATAMAIALHC
jgi:serine/threonine-protein kinase